MTTSRSEPRQETFDHDPYLKRIEALEAAVIRLAHIASATSWSDSFRDEDGMTKRACVEFGRVIDKLREDGTLATR